jgi:hypothetical protein
MPLTLSDAVALAKEEGAPRLTVFRRLALPGEDRRKSEIALRHVHEEAEQALRKAGHEDAAALLRPLAELRDDPEVARQRHGALAAFLSADAARIEWLDGVEAEGAAVGPRFRLAAAWPAVEDAAPLAALVATQAAAELKMIEPGRVRPIEAEEMPGSLEDFLGPKEIEPHRGGTDRFPGRTWHGTGDSPEQDRREELVNYAAAVANATQKALAGSGTPLVIVADEQLHGMLRERLDGYADLCAEGVTEHPQELDEARLVERVRAAARPLREARRADDQARLDQALGRGDPASEDEDEVLAAAEQGRVDVLFFSVAHAAPLDDPRAARLDAALACTLANGGRARATAGAEKPLRALLRY